MNITAKTLFKIGSVAIMLMGAGHTIMHFMVKGKNSASAHVIAEMDKITVNIFGLGSRSLLDFHHGFSITMGAILFFAGLQNYFLSKSLRTSSENNPGILWVPVVTAGVVFVLSLKYFIILPQSLSLIALLAYSFGLWKLRMEKSVATS